MQARTLQFRLDLDAPIEEVWQAWTTEEGARAWFAPECRIDLRPGGAYEMYWELQLPKGQQGSDEMIVLAAQEPHLLSFTWNAPVDMGDLRQQRTHIIVRLEALDDERTRLHFCEDGWGEGPEWAARYDYFERAWGSLVLPLLAYRLAEGPVDWQALPDLSNYRPMVKIL